METITYFEFKTFGNTERLKRLKVNFNDLICLFTFTKTLINYESN